MAVLEEADIAPATLLDRHCAGDGGDLPSEDAAENDFSLGRNLRLITRYTLASDGVVWIITEADRSVTTILLPEEY